MTQDKSYIITKARVPPEASTAFGEWQAAFNAEITTFPLFESLEISLSPNSLNEEWNVVQRFFDRGALIVWRDSEVRVKLVHDLEELIGKQNVSEEETDACNSQTNITEIFVTQVSPENVDAFKNWTAKMHSAEAQFPGFRGVYLQSPKHSKSGNWISLLQFDTQLNLDKWLTSPERQILLEEAGPLVTSFESHRVISPYSGWFSSFAPTGESPPAWKQSMIVLLALYPIVMLEKIFLNPELISLQPAVAMFIGNSLSVALLTWPMVPLCIYFLQWWLKPLPHKRMLINGLGTGLILLLYIIQVVVFWYH